MTPAQVTTHLRVQVEDVTAAGVNQLLNPSGGLNLQTGLGGAGWRVDPGRILTSITTPAGLSVFTVPGYTQGPQSEDVPVVPGEYIGGRITLLRGAPYVRVRFNLYDSQGTLVGSSAWSSFVQGLTGNAIQIPTVQVLAGSAQARINIEVSTSGSSSVAPTLAQRWDWKDAVLVRGATAAAVANPANVPMTYVDVLGSAVSLALAARTFDATLTAVIRDAALDPAVVNTLRTGLALRVLVRDAAGATLVPIWTGRIVKPTVDYGDLKRGDRPTINLTGTGPAADLASQARPNGVATILELANLLEGTRQPYFIDGLPIAQQDNETVRSVNQDATMLDQALLARDSALGYVWIGPDGVFRGLTDRTAAAYPVTAARPALVTLDEDDYSSLSVTYDPETCINSVTVVQLGFDPSTGETIETTWGPYEDPLSIRQNGRQAQTFRVHLIGSPGAYATSVLAANKTPVRRVEKLRIPIRDVGDNITSLAYSMATLPIYQRVRVKNTAKGLDVTMRVLGIDHSVDSRGRWYLDVTFTDETTVATPQVTPAVTDTAKYLADNGGKVPAVILAAHQFVDVVIAHGLGVVPTYVLCNAWAGVDFGCNVWDANATNITLRVFHNASNVAVNTSVPVSWKVYR